MMYFCMLSAVYACSWLYRLEPATDNKLSLNLCIVLHVCWQIEIKRESEHMVIEFTSCIYSILHQCNICEIEIVYLFATCIVLPLNVILFGYILVFTLSESLRFDTCIAIFKSISIVPSWWSSGNAEHAGELSNSSAFVLMICRQKSKT
ncbi:hypothetical protein VPH35_104403 [Triticum aestivum]